MYTTRETLEMNSLMFVRRRGPRVLVALSAVAMAPAFAAYPAWQPDVFYTAGTIVLYNTNDYQALVNQTDYSSTGWNPMTASLWRDLGPDAGSGTPPPPPPPPPPPTSGGTCAPAWSATTVYTGGNQASENGINYQANWWTQGDDPATHNGGAGSGQPWTQTGACSTGTPPPPPPPPPPGGPPPSGFIFSPYKDITVNMNWNTNVISTSVTGTMQGVLTVTPSNLKTLTWAFATGECGSETWGGLPPSAVAAANVQSFVSSGKFYILSTGGAAGSFTCGSDSGFEKFIQTYNSANLLGIDFDIESGQSQSVIDNLIQRVIVAQRNHPNLRFSFTLATLGGNAPQSLGSIGVTVMNSIKSAGLTKYTINLMTMDYGSAIPTNCTMVGGVCEMGQSAVAAAENLHSNWGVPYNQIEITPMIGGNDTQSETFTLSDVGTVAAYAKQKGLAGVHFWSFDRDTDCAPGFASPTCNSYGAAGKLGFTMQFLSQLGL